MMSIGLKNLMPRKPSKVDSNEDGRGSANSKAKGSNMDGESSAAGSASGVSSMGQEAESYSSPLAGNIFFDPVSLGAHQPSTKKLDLSSSSLARMYVEPLPAFRDVPSSERKNLLVKKLALCCCLFDFIDPTKHVREKEIKRQTLLELVEYVTSGTGKFSEVVYEDIINMVAVNLFRAFPPPSHYSGISDTFDTEDDEPLMDPSWPHLQIVYEFLLRFVVSTETDAKTAKRYIDHSFVLKLLDLFDSEDPREREYLKTILHRIYGKFMVHRPFIRKAISNIFYRFIFETEKHNGIAELLEILGSIINGFASPLKEEHKLFPARALIPLHKPKSVGMYHHQLSYCITQYIEKDSKLADVVIRGLLKYWPVTNTQKEVLFLGELEEVLEGIQTSEFRSCVVPLFRQISRCLNNQHFQVAERALFLWNNDHVVSLVAQNREVILPIIFSSLEMNNRGHWNHVVHGLTQNVRKMFSGLDPVLFEECHNKFIVHEEEAKLLEQNRERLWEQLERVAASRASSAAALVMSPTLAKGVSLDYGQIAVMGT